VTGLGAPTCALRRIEKYGRAFLNTPTMSDTDVPSARNSTNSAVFPIADPPLRIMSVDPKKASDVFEGTK